MTTYTIKSSQFRNGRKTCTAYHVVDDAGRVYCNESTHVLALAHIDVLIAADKRNEGAQKECERLEAEKTGR